MIKPKNTTDRAPQKPRDKEEVLRDELAEAGPLVRAAFRYCEFYYENKHWLALIPIMIFAGTIFTVDYGLVELPAS